MIKTGQYVFLCQEPGYFLLRENYVEAGTLYSYYLVFLTDHRGWLGFVALPEPLHPLHPQGSQTLQQLWQPGALLQRYPQVISFFFQRLPLSFLSS